MTTKGKLKVWGMLVVVTMIAIVIARDRASSLRDEETLLAIQSVSEVELRLGSPVFVHTTYPPTFGKNLVSRSEFERGVVIEAYRFRKMPPVFLIIKRLQGSDRVIRSAFAKS